MENANRLTAEQLASMTDHMNCDHADALVAYARHFARIEDAVSARISCMDVRGIDLAVEAVSGNSDVRIAFDHELADPDDGRQTLIAMLRTANHSPG